MKDRSVEYPNRYRLQKVDGTDDIYDLVPAPGEVTDEGTFINKATLLKDATAALYGLGGDAVPDDVLEALNTSIQVQRHCSLGDYLWAESTTVGTTVAGKGMATGNGIFAVLDNSADSILYTKDGNTWSSTAFSLDCNYLYFVNGLFFVTTGASSGVIYSSADCETWTNVIPGSYTGISYGIAYGNGLYVVTRANGQVLYSSDLITWTKSAQTLTGSRQVAFLNGVFTAHYGDSVNAKYWYSSDGETWIESAFPVAVQQNTAKICNGEIWVLGSSGSAYYAFSSVDGINWTQHNFATAPNDIAHNGTEYMIPANGKIYFSNDGSSWVEGTIPASVSFHACAYAFSRFWVLSVTVGILYSGVPLYRGTFTDVLGNLIGIPGEQIVDGVQVVTGSYTGTGTYGASNPNSLTFDFEPKAVFISSTYYSAFLLFGVADAPRGCVFYSGNTSAAANNTYGLVTSWNGDTVSWYNTGNANVQLNTSSYTYTYTAIG